MDKTTSSVVRIAVNGLFVGLFLALSFLRIRLGFVEIGFGSAITILSATLFSPLDGFLVGAIGEFLYQVFFSGYGLSPTTLLWVLPVALRPLLIGIAARIMKKKGKEFVGFNPIYFITLSLVALFISGLDTGVMYLDGLIMGYPVSYTFIQTLLRFVSSQITAVLISFILLPLHKAGQYVYKPAIKEEKGNENR